MRISDWSSDVCSSDLGAGQSLLCQAVRMERIQGVLVSLLHTQAAAIVKRVPEDPSRSFLSWRAAFLACRQHLRHACRGDGFAEQRSEDGRVGKECGG